MEYDNTNSGALFKNAKKQKDTQPDYRGSLNVEGTDYWISAWLKTSKKGEKFMSLAVTLQDEQKQDKPKQEAPSFDDDLPS
jgi:uncharacterized protein (DUF736 family)